MNFRRMRETVDDAADKLKNTAADTKAAVVTVAVVAGVALLVGLIALAVAIGKD